MLDSVTDDSGVRIELSKVPTSLVGVNGAIDPFAMVSGRISFVTNGLSQNAQNGVIPLAVDCRQGEIIYFHTLVSGTITYFFNAIFHY